MVSDSGRSLQTDVANSGRRGLGNMQGRVQSVGSAQDRRY